MSSCIVSMTRVADVKPHPDAERLDVCTILGWQVVVQKGSMKSGDLVVYFPPSTILPEKWIEHWGIRKYLAGSEANRIHQVKLRGEPSFGFATSVPEGLVANEGDNVAEWFGAIKYEIPLDKLPQDATQKHPYWTKYTEIENMRNFPDVFVEGETVAVREKIHGFNTYIGRIFEADGTVTDFASSHDTQRAKPETEEEMKKNFFWYAWTIPGMSEMIDKIDKDLGDQSGSRLVEVFGEIFGSHVQSLTYGCGENELRFAVFDIRVKGKYLDNDILEKYLAEFNIPIAPLVYRGPFSLAKIRELSEGVTVIGGGCHIREGVVVKPLTERNHTTVGRVVLKYISDSYLFSKHAAQDKADV